MPETNTEKFAPLPPAAPPATARSRAAAGTRRRWLSLCAFASACAISVAALAHNARVSAVTNEPARPTLSLAAAATTAASAAPAAQDRDFSTFSHSISEHRQNCASCHRRTDNSISPRLPGHKACTDCHVQQFVTPAVPMCMICHTNLDSGNPPVKSFPGMRSFDARFTHAQHLEGAGRPENGCASCHGPMRRGVALSIPATLNAHSNCFQCHTPDAQSGGRDIGSCSTCHDLGRLSRASTGARAFTVGFSHATHGPRQRLDCRDCHTVRAGVAAAQQVSSPRPTQHFGSGRAQNCMTCHNNRRAFGGDDFSDCKRCHKGQTFRL